MKSIQIVLLFLFAASGSNIKILIAQDKRELVDDESPNVRLSDPLPITEGVLDLSICFRFLMNHYEDGKIFLMDFDYFSSLDHISTYLLWTLDGSKVQLFQRSNVKQLDLTDLIQIFQRFFTEYVQQEASGYMDQV